MPINIFKKYIHTYIPTSARSATGGSGACSINHKKIHTYIIACSITVVILQAIHD
jgi:hypothetical protein